MKKNIVKIAIFTAFSSFTVFSSCSNEFLDIASEENIAIDDQATQSPEKYVNGIYGMFTDWDYAFSWLGVTEMISDNADKGSSSTDNGGDKRDLDELLHSSTTGSVEAMWTKFYKTIGRSSYSIKYTTESTITDTEKSRLIGEAKFLRALSYFYLVRMFGDVVIQDLEDASTYSVRQPKAEVYAYIEEDLLDAISKLPLKSEYAAKDLGRATKGAAQGLLAKVYLYQGKNQQAYDMATTVINSGQYDLEADYATTWRVETENGKESLFEIQARGTAVAHGVQQYSETQGARGTGGWGWGFNVPSQNLLDAFNAEGDAIRRDATIIFRGETLYDGRLVPTSVENPMYNEKAYSSANLGSGDGDKNIRVIRFSEMLLIQAEAANEIGQDALSSLNRVRARVKLAPVSGLSKDQLRTKIWNERRLELAFEHDRWFDLVRTGQAKAMMAANGKIFVTGKHELFPIPNAQLIQTPSMTQNPGW
ncbi:Starch-binding associating with outer membrane [Algoriella xinjiangensis]|uniref:Starch-binding associating with outer membrane n=1 Tax=Algoriella xinjiangensis TaxID=684065 RepID=A0A1I4W665_9FLAO|nr:RagB/SusD family nutrient uptake outer membrane protein [Algoriella xinjiangensis]SFN08975.1 Starch-binding associating with outer membrane [Algoriella xinjiangensis]VDH15684.1 SusD family [Algoriella xinjiangensis]